MTSKDLPYQAAPPIWTQIGSPEPTTQESVSQQESNPEATQAECLRTQIETILEMWLQWNKTYQKLTQHMYEERTDFHRLEIMADQLDEMRLRAVEETQKLLSIIRKTSREM